MHTFAIVNQKGGCGKTTTAINLAGVFAGRGLRTLLVDMDPQGHCAAGLAIPEGRIDLHIGDAMAAPDDEPVDPARLLWRVSRNLDLAPSTVRLAALEAPRGDLAAVRDPERRLTKALARFAGQYDVCLIDCSPAIGLLAFNALVAANEILVPVETGFFSLQGASKQIGTIKSVGKRLGVAPPYRILPTMHEGTSVLSKDLLEELRRRFPGRVVPTVIRFDLALREAASFGQPVIEYAPESPGAQDYTALAEWLVENSLRAGASATPDEDDEPTPEHRRFPVQVVNGIGDRAMAGLISAPRATPPVAIPAPPLPAQPPVPTPPGDAGESLDPFAAPTVSRAADMANRARRFQAKPAGPAEETPPVAAPAPGGVSSAARSPADRALLPVGGPRFGIEITRGGVLFSQPPAIGRSVALAGEFNAWTPERTPLTLNRGTGRLEAFVELPPGITQYRLVVDGHWINDPYNPAIAPNPFGGCNSVLCVPEEAGLADAAPAPANVLLALDARSGA